MGDKPLKSLFQTRKDFFFPFHKNMILGDSVGVGLGCAEIVFLSSSDFFQEPLRGFR